jgi:hypothetical protein
MPIPIHNPVRGNGVERRSVAISFFPNGASDPVDVRDPNGDVASVTRTGQSAYLVTLNYPVQKVLSATATLQLAALADIDPQLGAYSSLEGAAGNMAIPIRLHTAAAAAAEVAANADNRVNLQLELELSSVAV